MLFSFKEIWGKKYQVLEDNDIKVLSINYRQIKKY